MPRASVNYALAATLIASGATLDQAAEKTGAKNAASLRVGLARRHVTIGSIRNAEGNVDRITGVATRMVSQASEQLRADLASILDKHVGALSAIPAKPNLKHIKAVGDAMEPLTRTAKIVHDWGSEQPNALVVAGLFTEPKPQGQIEPAQDIQAVVSPSQIPEPTPDTNPK